ncbi:MAG: tetratricopeptide repeat protein [Firmicutes bacterium]|nr:tetratricopeptide repeat protein [Bacillota bacterium]
MKPTYNKYGTIIVTIALALFLQCFTTGCGGNKQPAGQASSPALSSSPTPAQQGDAQKLAEEGRKYQEEGNLQKALECFNEAVKLAPDNSSFYAGRGLIHYQMKTYHLALEDYDKAVKLDPNSAMNYLNRGDAYLVMAKHDLAMKDYEQTIKLDPTRHGAWYHMGMIKIMRRQFDEALKDTEKAISLLPKNDEGYQFNKAFILYKLERYDDSLNAMKEVMKIAPDFDAAYKQMGDIYVEMGDSKKAIELYDKAIELFDSNQDKVNRREMNLYQKDIDKGLIYMNRAIAHSNLSHYKEVVDDCQKAIESGFNEPGVYQEKALAEYQLGEKSKASADAEKSLKLIDFKQPGFRKYINAYSAYMAMENYDKALEFNKKASDEILKLEPDHRELIIAYYSRAYILYNTGKYKEAMESLKPVLKNKREAYINEKAEKLAAMIKNHLK